MDIKDFEKRLNRAGLVPMKIAKSFAPYERGKIAGFSPKEAKRHFDAGFLIFPEDELYKHENRVPKVPAVTRNSVKKGEEGRVEGTPVKKTGEQGSGDRPTNPKDADKDPVIPDNWQELHHMKLFKLATEIVGDFDLRDGEKQSEGSARIVAAEIQRRLKEGGQVPEGAVLYDENEDENENDGDGGDEDAGGSPGEE